VENSSSHAKPLADRACTQYAQAQPRFFWERDAANAGHKRKVCAFRDSQQPHWSKKENWGLSIWDLAARPRGVPDAPLQSKRAENPPLWETGARLLGNRNETIAFFMEAGMNLRK
jgi:hypothetical protein